MERSRKAIFAALSVVFIAQFCRKEDSGHTTITMDLGRNLTTGGLPYGGRTGWQIYGGWSLFWVLVYGGLAYAFFSRPRRMWVYVLALVVIILTGLGSSTSGFLGLVAIAVAGYAIYRRRKEATLKLPGSEQLPLNPP